MEPLMWKFLGILVILGMLGCAANQGYNHNYNDMPPPLALYFDGGIRHLSFSAKLAVLDRVDYMNSNPELQAEIVGYAEEALATQLAHIVEQEFLSQGIAAGRIKIVSASADSGVDRNPHVAIRLK